MTAALTESGTPALVMCHISHVYPTGASLYFTVLAGIRHGLAQRIDPGPETIEARLFHEHEIPWDELAFRTVRETLLRYFADQRTGRFGTHAFDIE